jgi:hypothetical protein
MMKQQALASHLYGGPPNDVLQGGHVCSPVSPRETRPLGQAHLGEATGSRSRTRKVVAVEYLASDNGLI